MFFRKLLSTNKVQVTRVILNSKWSHFTHEQKNMTKCECTILMNNQVINHSCFTNISSLDFTFILQVAEDLVWFQLSLSLAISQYSDVIMSMMASQNTSLMIVYSTIYSGADQRKHQNSASLVFVRGIHHWPVNSPHKGPVTRKMFLFDDAIKVRSLFHSCKKGLKSFAES